MEQQQLHSNPTHTHDFSFYDHHRHEDIARDQCARESDLLNTIMSFPSASTQPVLLHRNSLQDRRTSPGSNSLFLQSPSSTTASLNIGGSRPDELLQLSGRLDVCDSDLAAREKLRDLRTLPGAISSRFQESILARLDRSSLGGADGVTWQTYSDVNDIAGTASVPNDALQLPINMNLGVHNMLSNILPVNSDQRGGANYGHRHDAMWAEDHGTELLLLPGISGASDEHTRPHQQIIPHKQPGNASDQDRQQSSSFSGPSTYATTSGGSLRDLSLSLAARGNSQHAHFNARGNFLTGSTGCSQTQSSIYLKAAQNVLREECSKAIAGAGGSIVTKGDAMCSNAPGVAASAIASNELRFASGGRSGALTVGSSINVHAQESDIFRTPQQYHHHHHQHLQQQQQQVPAAMAHLQLQDQYGRVQAYSHNGGGQMLQPAIMMDRSQQLELKRRKLYIMLEELENRFKKYEEHMQMLVIELETSGVGMMLDGAAPYKEAAERTIQNRFTSLRDAILASESFGIGGFSGHEGAHQAIVLGATGECDQVGVAAATRFRLLDQQLRHQRALQQVGLFPQPPWRPQRGLPERSVSLLRAWLFDHFLHPYPKDTEKVLLARQTGLTRNQVSNWFINARVRLWKPMVEEMYQEEMKTAEIRRATGQGNLIKPTSISHTTRGTTGSGEAHHLHIDQSKKHMKSDFDNHLMAIQDMSSMNAIQGVETSRFYYKQSDFINDSQSRQFQPHQEDQGSFATSLEVPPAKAAIATVLDATHTWPFIQHQNGAFDAQEQQQHYCSSDISTALMRFGSSGGVTLTLGLQQHSGGGGSMNCAGPPFERSPAAGVDDVNAAHRWCE